MAVEFRQFDEDEDTKYIEAYLDERLIATLYRTDGPYRAQVSMYGKFLECDFRAIADRLAELNGVKG